MHFKLLTLVPINTMPLTPYHSIQSMLLKSRILSCIPLLTFIKPILISLFQLLLMLLNL